jgi:hypothetical protein
MVFDAFAGRRFMEKNESPAALTDGEAFYDMRSVGYVFGNRSSIAEYVDPHRLFKPIHVERIIDIVHAFAVPRMSCVVQSIPVIGQCSSSPCYQYMCIRNSWYSFAPAAAIPVPPVFIWSRSF